MFCFISFSESNNFKFLGKCKFLVSSDLYLMERVKNEIVFVILAKLDLMDIFVLTLYLLIFQNAVMDDFLNYQKGIFFQSNQGKSS